jgi:hypothetical protein
MAVETVEVAEVGETRMVELQVAAGGTVSRVSPGVAGPVVVERVAAWANSTAAEVDVAVHGVPAGVDVGTATPPEQLPGVPLWRTLAPTGFVTTGNLLIFQGFFEAWPRVVLAWQSLAFAVSVRNIDPVNAFRVAVAVDVRRAVVR